MIDTNDKKTELFQLSGYMPDVEGIDWSSLPPFLRVLLSTDGTVTKSLEAYFWEPVKVSRSAQYELSENEAIDQCAIQGSEPVWRRDVQLIGKHSQRCYAKASSIVCFARLPDVLCEELKQDRMGIGGVIRELGMETYRKIIAVGQTPTMPEKAEAIWRTYVLYYKGQVLMHITETFDLKAF